MIITITINIQIQIPTNIDFIDIYLDILLKYLLIITLNLAAYQIIIMFYFDFGIAKLFSFLSRLFKIMNIIGYLNLY